jgi:hypothetical protein
MARKVVEDDRARQGPKGRPVLLVLIGSGVLLGIYLLSMLVWSGTDSPTQPSQDASRQSVSPPAASSTASGAPPANPAYPAPSTPTADTPPAATSR